MYYGELPPIVAAPLSVAAVSGLMVYFLYLLFVASFAFKAKRVFGEVRKIEVDYRRTETLFRQNDGNRYVKRPSVYRILYCVEWRGRMVGGEAVYIDDRFWGRSPATRRVKQLVKQVVEEGDRKVEALVWKGRRGFEVSLRKGPPARHWIFATVVSLVLAGLLWAEYREYLTTLSTVIGVVVGVLMFKVLFGHDGRRREWQELWTAENGIARGG